MKTILLPIFDEFENYKLTHYKEVKIKNKPDHKDYIKVCRMLPGIPQGGSGALNRNEFPIEIQSFYDMRQNSKRFKGYYITLKQLKS